MGLFRPSRERRGADRWLDAKLLLFSLGGAVGVSGMLLDREWLVLTGIAILVVGFLLRFLPRDEE